jgi:hypothetical protein
MKVMADAFRVRKCAQVRALLDSEVWRVLQITDPDLVGSLESKRAALLVNGDVCPDGHLTFDALAVSDLLANSSCIEYAAAFPTVNGWAPSISGGLWFPIGHGGPPGLVHHVLAGEDNDVEPIEQQW